MTNSPAPETSIVIRALNEQRWLPDVFAALHKQKYRDFETILVDSGSVDATRDIAAANGARIVRLRSEDFTFGHSLNVGVSESRGRFIAIVSAHAIPSDENWLGRLVEPLRREEVAMVYGGQRGHAVSKFSECRDFERMFGEKSFEVDPEQPFANNANSAIRRDLWETYQFDKGLPGLEDIDWAKYWLERGRKVVYQPDACIIHVHTETWPQVRRRYYREGMAARWVGIRILRSIPSEVTRELWWGLKDYAIAARQGKFGALAGEITRFRYEKLVGTVGGITDSRGLLNPARRAEMFFGNGFPALVVRGPNRMQLEERNVPSLKPGEILVRVSHVGIGSSDLALIEGRSATPRAGTPPYPIVPGRESSGTVVAVGPKVTEFQEGDRVVVEGIQGCGECTSCRADNAVYCEDRHEVGGLGRDGACAGYMVSRARYAHKVPAELSLAKAALAEPLAVVHKGLRRLGSLARGDRPMRCAVTGAGTIGHLAALLLKARGHSVVVFDAETDRLRALRGSVETSTALRNVREFDWIIEASGKPKVLTALVEQSHPGAALLLLGFPYADQSFNFELLAAHDRALLGSVGASRRDFAEALGSLPALDVSPFLETVYPLEQYDKALARARAQDSLKVMFTFETAAT
jgi:2-desacetyl-2-hydroxyethyl bacteriochlorophyllide A dehydrogenase